MDAPSEEYQGRKKALIISISDYDYLEPLSFCKNDGEEMYGVLNEVGYEIPENRKIIGRVNYSTLRDAIIEFFTDEYIHPRDTILFYFSGHGVPSNDGEEHFLSSSGIEPKRPRLRGFSFDELTRTRQECNSKTVFTILDCCYSGAAEVSKGDAASAANIGKGIIASKSSNVGEGRCILAACKPMQEAYPIKGYDNSIFTYYLIEALKGVSKEAVDDYGNITPTLLSKYIDNRIASLPPEERPKQRPYLRCESAGEIIIASHPDLVLKKPKDEEAKSRSDEFLKLLQDGTISESNNMRKAHEDVPLFLRRVDLTGKDLRGVDLHGVDLTEAKLANSKLSYANLNGANLNRADLREADLRSVELNGASLVEANLSDADLRGADLKGMVDFSKANLTKADFRGVDVTGMANFTYAILRFADFRGSATDNALINWNGADMYGALGIRISQRANEYSESLKSFLEVINQQFKTYNIAKEQIGSIEGTLKELSKEVENIQEPDKISQIQRENIKTKLTLVIEQLIICFPKTSEAVEAFSTLSPFSKVIGEEVKQFADRILKQGVTIESKSANRNMDTDKDQSLIRESDDAEQISIGKKEGLINQKSDADIKEDSKKWTGALSWLNPDIKQKPKIPDPENMEKYESSTKTDFSISNWNNLLNNNVRSVFNEDIGRVVRISDSNISIVGNHNHIYTIPKNSIQQAVGEVIINISLREMNYFDTTIEPRKFYGKNINLHKLGNGIHEYLKQSKFDTRFFDDHTSNESRFHIQAIKGGKFRTLTTRRQKADVLIMGNPNDFSIKIFAGESPFQVAEKMQTFIHLSGLEKDIWNYIERSVDQFKETSNRLF